jgi:hypothetical protein
MDNLQLHPLTLCLVKAGLSAGTTSTLSTTATIQYGINGKFSTPKGAITNGATPTLDAATGLAFTPISANQGTIVVVCLDAAGNLKAVQGSVVGLDVSGAFMVLAPTWPVIPDNAVPHRLHRAQGRLHAGGHVDLRHQQPVRRSRG